MALFFLRQIRLKHQITLLINLVYILAHGAENYRGVLFVWRPMYRFQYTSLTV